MRKGDSTEILWLLLLLCVYKAVTSNHTEREEMLFLPSFEQWQQPLQIWFVIKRECRGSPVCWAVMCPILGAFSVCVCVCVLVAQSCLTPCDPMDCSPPGSSVHRILQRRILEWVVIPFSRGSSRPEDWTQVSCIAGRRFTIWTTREACFLCIVSCNHLKNPMRTLVEDPKS